ncbi:MAG: exonuclease domain-containing protein [Lentisphaeria bacterium]|nr:exonuclease domain-containing protein [Lentisphaeria bacterium]
MLARDAAFTSIDFETTGVVGDAPSLPWQVGLVFFAAGRVRGDHQFTSLLRVGDRPFNFYAPGRHARLRKEIAAAPTLCDLWPVLTGWLTNRLLVAHNTATEKKCLSEAFPLWRCGGWIDTLTLARIAYPDASSHQLSDLLAILNLKEATDRLCPGLEAHDALYDACASAVLLEHFLALPGWENVTVEHLLNARPESYRRLRKKSPPS